MGSTAQTQATPTWNHVVSSTPEESAVSFEVFGAPLNSKKLRLPSLTLPMRLSPSTNPVVPLSRTLMCQEQVMAATASAITGPYSSKDFSTEGHS